MRIVQLSDLHLSKSNLKNFQNYFLNALTKDLKEFHSQQPIDIILLTGDLVDKGGQSLGRNPYDNFKKIVIDPISKTLSLSDDRFLFIAGNHDIERDKIEKENEFYLAENLNPLEANKLITNKNDKKTTKRIKKFKSFEQTFHSDNPKYYFSIFESAAVVDVNNKNIGFALINDSWRCSDKLDKEKHFIGSNQLFDAKNFLDSHNTKFNIAVFHHPLELINEDERDSIDNILKNQNFTVAFFGHTHRHKIDSVSSANGTILMINGRAAFNNSDEKESRFQPGYNILDLDFDNWSYTLNARKFIKTGFRFDKDTDSLPNGIISNSLPKQTFAPLGNISDKENMANDKNLPICYQADVEKVVKLLIGNSLYPDSFIFVRELVQNSVDACHRIQEQYSTLNPQIKVIINSSENSFEIIDEGDGMNKRILREHFSVVGKSISQEFTEANNQINLISKFGIGFISTFIVAEKVIIITKHEDDEIVKFEIKDVFKNFVYDHLGYHNPLLSNTGTSVKVYLKRRFNVINAFDKLISICRHLDNLNINLDGTLCSKNNSWNTENGIFFWEEKNTRYDCKLTISNQSRDLIATNSGFYICHNPETIYPFMFPRIIGGEIVFQPKTVDLDLSRSKIMPSPIANDIKKEISKSLRYLFRQVIDSEYVKDKTLITNYLQYYLINFDSYQISFENSYSDFYSKVELIQLCASYLMFPYQQELKSLQSIMTILKNNHQDNNIYFYEGNLDELSKIVQNYFSLSKKLVVVNNQITVNFFNGGNTFYSTQSLQVIAAYHNFNLVDIRNISLNVMEQLLIDKKEISSRIMDGIYKIENTNYVNIKIANFIQYPSSMVKYGANYYINYNSTGFQNLLQQASSMSEKEINIYLSGYLGLPFSMQEA